MSIGKATLCLMGLVFASPVWCQHSVDAANRYHRVIAIVPVTGRGTWNDPKRPMFVPVNPNPTDRNGIIAYQHQLSDDGTVAIVELVAANRGALTAILTSNNPAVIAFEIGKHTRAEIEPVLQRVSKHFSFDNFQPLRVQ